MKSLGIPGKNTQANFISILIILENVAQWGKESDIGLTLNFVMIRIF